MMLAGWRGGQIIDKLTPDRTESNGEHDRTDGVSLMLPESKSAYERLGRLLADRRVGIAARYKNKNLFAEEREINRRMVWSVESGARDNYTPDTVRDIERAYALVPGSLGRTVAGGELEPLHAAPAVPRVPVLAPAHTPEGDPQDDAAAILFPGDTRHDRIIRNIWRLGAYGTSREERIAMIAVVDPGLAAALEDVGGQSEAGLQRAVQSQLQCNESDTLALSGSHRTVLVRQH